MMPPDLIEPARHVAGEVGQNIAFCGFSAQLAAMWVYSRNPTFYASAQPTFFHLWLAKSFQGLPDTSNGAEFMFSREDLTQPRVQRIIRTRPPPTIYKCSGGLELWFF